MKKIVVYLLVFLVSLGFVSIWFLQGFEPAWLADYRLAFLCILMGGIGGCVYCLRAVYLNYSVKKTWDDDWQPWYYIRPFLSLVCGGVSYIFMKAGLLILESQQSANSTDLGFIALAFIAGLNVDKFISKIEDVARATFGIEKSRSVSDQDKENSEADHL